MKIAMNTHNNDISGAIRFTNGLIVAIILSAILWYPLLYWFIDFTRR